MPENIGPNFNTGRVLTISASHACNDIYSGFLPPLLPELIQRFSMTNAQAGLLSAFLQFPYILQPLMGYVADRISLRYLVILAPGITATAMSLLGIAPSYVLIALLLTVAGLSSAGTHAIGPVMVGEDSGARAGRAIGIWMVGGNFGGAIGPMLIVLAIGWFGIEGTTWLMLGGWAVSIMLFYRLRETSEKPADLHRRLPWETMITQMRPLLAASALFHMLQSFSSVALLTYMPILLNEGGASLRWTGASLFILQVGGMMGAFVGGSLSDRVGRRRVLAISLAATAILIVLFVCLSGSTQGLLLPFLGFFSMSTSPVMLATMQECYPENRAMANGLYMALWIAIRSTILVLFGWIGDVVGLRNAFLLSAVFSLLGLPIVRMFPSPPAGRERG
jgi:FSR family fosmidomycin resistance protein-like MFS transporter